MQGERRESRSESCWRVSFSHTLGTIWRSWEARALLRVKERGHTRCQPLTSRFLIEPPAVERQNYTVENAHYSSHLCTWLFFFLSPLSNNLQLVRVVEFGWLLPSVSSIRETKQTERNSANAGQRVAAKRQRQESEEAKLVKRERV